MFYDNFLALCGQKGVTPSAVMRAIGLNKSSASYWKKGSTPSSDTLRKLADYFDVSMDYLLGNVRNPKHVLSESNTLGVTAYTVLPDDVQAGGKGITLGNGSQEEEGKEEFEEKLKKLSEAARVSLQLRLSSITEGLSYDDLEALVKYAQFIQAQQPPQSTLDSTEDTDTTPPPDDAQEPQEDE